MTREAIVQAWKNPEVRATAAELPAHPAGPALVELDDAALQEIFGRGDVQAETSPFCVGFTVGVGIGVILSVLKC